MGVGVVVVAPVVEELFFRGLLLGTVRERWGTFAAVIGSSVFFGATHFQPLQFAGLTAAGLVFAAAVVKTGRLGSAIEVHVGFNAKIGRASRSERVCPYVSISVVAGTIKKKKK